MSGRSDGSSKPRGVYKVRTHYGPNGQLLEVDIQKQHEEQRQYEEQLAKERARKVRERK
jgi:hypothetical protein